MESERKPSDATEVGVAAVDSLTMEMEDQMQGLNVETSLLSLPDDDLLSVLDYLSTPDLLSCLAVCHRLRDVALRPELWRRRSIGFVEHNVSTRNHGAAVLRMAPCASRLSMRFDGHSDALRTLAATTKCAVAELIIRNEHDSVRPEAAKLVIRNQAAPGTLRALDVLAEVFSPQGLTRLAVEVPESSYPEAEPAPLSPASIKEVTLVTKDPRFVHCVLRSHAATLQAVKLRGDCQGVAPLLAAIPGLQHLDCPVMEDLPLLTRGTSLRSLRLTLKEDQVAFQATAAAFLRTATHLEELDLSYACPAWLLGEQRLLTALASSGQAALRKLVFSLPNYTGLTTSVDKELAAALPGLPALEWLILPQRVCWRVLNAINPDNLPRLRGLSLLGCSRVSEPQCTHATVMHLSNVRHILAKYSQFYLVVRSRSCEESKWSKLCEHCLRGCHGVPWPGNSLIGFYTHEAPGKDVVDELRCTNWIKL
ncbi:uncharacterized protein LOC117642629 [Thrips palmi]|uniref:Uncharacterized protein LOC117642629 n=1 Tax=Thrips palmi TaxID=161013 RepID=A0A6P8YS15_THRPL|nr:uncharacterized protein LOC117642629 [Thrips palmi]XP_034236887.1 uncharacterized protein LOC117642629 [Thrips palmi]XP_034236889.1 uncharacterized protein LOC117642629 [Thrips palmi]XP_034236890.1 uncharacterized protein LOC117642629 [Thrips palmi]XP_034236891.1 uncharacterized protein LOC117642629 [Thrips palmi]XP_034236892.1 uncharacterized protein LOC117642629 [Thrips palmi]XP_034236893.1 uncharacterized protein LOC117642629 [Thrips palmi]XP_034236894.1 uncharacterized protein LOC1176